jgi:predicted DNA-binding transcriptional regulator YafY
MRRTDNRKFEQLKRAILGKRILHITYCSTSGAITERDIKPIKLVFKDKNWYLQAFCLVAEAFRLFKMSRIMEMSLLDATFSVRGTGGLPRYVLIKCFAFEKGSCRGIPWQLRSFHFIK